MDRELRHLFIPVEKDGETYRAILSDDSIDRDQEFMSPDLIMKWGNSGSLPLLANHENEMQSFIGAWKNPRVVNADGHTALQMEPNFFSASANPLAQQIKTQIDEASAMGLSVGVSVGFIPQKGMMVGERYMHMDAELVEASIVPVQSNRSAYVTMAKRFNLEINSHKKTSVASEDGDRMDGENKSSQGTAAGTTATPTMEERMKTLEELRAKEKAEFEVKLADAEKKRVEAETKIATQLEEYSKSLKEIRDAPKGKVPAAMLGKSGVGKENTQTEKDEPYNATKAWAKAHGLPDAE
jgi:hypothetical protein